MHWLAQENAKRAPYYIKQAHAFKEKALNQRKGVDKSNNDPFIATYDATHQALAAVDLAPYDANIWREAGQVVSLLADLDEDSDTRRKQGLHMLAQACKIDKTQVDKLLKWSKEKGKGESKGMAKIRGQLGKAAQKWKSGTIPEPKLKPFLPTLMARLEADTCATGMESLAPDGDVKLADTREEQIKQAIAGMAVRPLFPTLLTVTNVKKYFPDGFSERLADMGIQRYRAFSADEKKRGVTDPNDINDGFFSAQHTAEGAQNNARALKFWPELYKSPEYTMLMEFMKHGLHAHAKKTGFELTPEDAKQTNIVLWAAVYLEDGGRHGYHVHQQSYVSCVFYAKAPASATPLVFVDPRGAPPTADYEQHAGEHAFEPMPPFHHHYHHFAEDGDLVCFPSWLVHKVPSHFEAEPRVAFPANLQSNVAWDAWYNSATVA